MSLSMWSAVRTDLKTRIGQDSFRNWIEPLDFQGIEDRSVSFEVPSQFFASWIRESYGREILNLFWEHGGKVAEINFRVRGSDEQPSAKGAKAARDLTRQNVSTDQNVATDKGGNGGITGKPPASKPGATQNGAQNSGQASSPAMNAMSAEGQGISLAFPSHPPNPDNRFENFVTGKSNVLAFNAAKRVAESDEVQHSPLFLYSGVGLGKTHLMHAIAIEIAEKSPHRRVLFLSAEQFMYRFVEALRSQSTYLFKESLRSVDVLLVDDVQFIAGKESTQDEFFYTFNALVDRNKQIIISADRAPGDLEGIGERIRSRLQWGLMVDIHPADYELRLGILQSKSEIWLRDHPQMRIEEGVLEFLAHRISSNVRVLEGALRRLFAFADLHNAPVSLELAYHALSELLRASRQKLTLDLIIKKTAEFYNIRISDITGKRRNRAVTRPRQIAMHMAKNLTTKSLPEIGRAFGGRDHSTVIHAVKKIDDLMRHDGSIAEEVETLRRQLEA